MKKFGIFLAVSLFSAISLQSQSVTPRYGDGSKYADNTGRSLTYKSTTITPTGTMVTIPSLNLNAYESNVTIATTTISTTFTAATTYARAADKVTVVMPLSASQRTITFSTGFIGNQMATYSGTVLPVATNSTQVIPANSQAIFKWQFDYISGKYFETSRSVQ